jgi:hypothetical protein
VRALLVQVVAISWLDKAHGSTSVGAYACACPAAQRVKSRVLRSACVYATPEATTSTEAPERFSSNVSHLHASISVPLGSCSGACELQRCVHAVPLSLSGALRWFNGCWALAFVVVCYG